MRYRDADHVDTGSFYARCPQLGRVYRMLGYGGVAFAWYHINDNGMLARLLVLMVVVWLVAWYRVVGALWRSSVVAAILLCAVALTAHQLAQPAQPASALVVSP